MAEHITVLLNEAVNALNIHPDGVYVDGTFGRGGHSRLILSQLSPKGRLIVFDKDPAAIAVAEDLAKEDARITVVHSGFAQLKQQLEKLGVAQLDGALFDLGISSPQIDEAHRGFSFRYDAPLDMRMDTSSGMTAAQWLAQVDEAELATVIKEYGEERFSRRIAQQIVSVRQEAPIETTKALSHLVAQCVKTREKGQNPATRTFQAIRIYINRELEEVEMVLPQVLALLKEEGRLSVIAFHSLEDRIVKQFIQKYSKPPVVPKWVMLKDSDVPKPALKKIGKAQKASDEEVKENPRARSAVLRVAQRTDGLLEA